QQGRGGADLPGCQLRAGRRPVQGRAGARRRARQAAQMSELRRIGVIGAGQMGRGIAHVCALAGLDVVLTDNNPAALAQARETIAANLSRQVARGRITEEDKEAATEKEEIKRDIFKKLVPLLKPEALIATNTSSISITRLASATDRPGKFI